jgi:hypothetical protein
MSISNYLNSIHQYLQNAPLIDPDSNINLEFKKLIKNNTFLKKDNSKMANLTASLQILSLSNFETSEPKSDFNTELFVNPINVGKISIPNLPKTVLPVSPDLETITETKTVEPSITDIINTNTINTPQPIKPALQIVKASTISTAGQVMDTGAHIYTLDELTKKGVTKPVLQEILIRLGGKKTGNKDELINRILELQKNVV